MPPTSGATPVAPTAGSFPFPVVQPTPSNALPPGSTPPSLTPQAVALVVVPAAAMPPNVLRVIQPLPPEVVPTDVPGLAPAEKQPMPYVPPVYLRKQERN